jgi:hypothetical protein
MRRRALVALLLLAALAGFGHGGGAVVTAYPPWQQMGQSFYPNTGALGSGDGNKTYHASRLTMRNGPCAITSIKVRYTNSSINQYGTGEEAAYNAYTSPIDLVTGTYAAALEYPLGTTPAAFAWSTNPTVTISAATSFMDSDALTVAIPANATYAIQTLVNATTGPVAAFMSHSGALPSGSGVVEGTSQPSQYGTSGPWAGTVSGKIVAPLLVLGYAPGCSEHAVIIKGGSHATGAYDSGAGDPGDANGYVGFPMRALDLFANLPPFLCVCINGAGIQSYGSPTAGVNTVENAVMGNFTNSMVFDFPNDVNDGRTAAQIESDMSRWIDDFKATGGKTLWMSVAPPQTGAHGGGGSTDDWATFTGQTSETLFASGGVGYAVNTWVKVGMSNGNNAFTALDHVSGAGGIGGQCSAGVGLPGASDITKWCVSTADTAYYATNGGDHPNATSYPIGAAAVYAALNPGSTAYGLLQ